MPALRTCSLLATALLAATAGAQTTHFVDANLLSGADDGTSWANAFQGSRGLQAAIAAHSPGDQIWVAQGTYIPSQTGGRNVSFNARSGLEIYGGFAGGESSVAQRPAFGVAPSILSGDLSGNDGSGTITDNSYHVLRGGVADNTGLFDGFTVTGGFANGSNNEDSGAGVLVSGSNTAPVFRNIRFEGNRAIFGGGVGYIINSARPTFDSCQFIDNNGGSFGGGFDMAGGGPARFEGCLFQGNFALRAGALEVFASSGVIVSNCVFYDNRATGSGGGGALWFGNGGTHQVRNCTVFDNQSTNQNQGGLRVQGSTVQVANSIFWDNSGPGGAQSASNQIAGTSNVTYCIVEGGFAGTGNVGSDPQLLDPVGGDFSLPSNSPAIDAGDNSGVAAGVLIDYLDNERFVDIAAWPDTGNGAAPVVDIGAVERQEGSTSTLYCSGDGSGTACPCSNDALAGQGCANSTGAGAELSFSGSLSVAADDLTPLCTNLPALQPALFFTGTGQVGGGNGAVFGDGLRCVGGTVVRLGVQSADAGGSASWGPGLAALAGWSAGDTANIQAWYRDPGGTCGSGFNLSNAHSFTLTP